MISRFFLALKPNLLTTPFMRMIISVDWCLWIALDKQNVIVTLQKRAVNKETCNLDTDNHTDMLNYRGGLCKVYSRGCSSSGKNLLFMTLTIMKGLVDCFWNRIIIKHECIEKFYLEIKRKWMYHWWTACIRGQLLNAG